MQRYERAGVLGIVWLCAWLAPMPTLGAEAVGSPASILKKGQWVMSASGGAAPNRTLQGDAEARLYQGGHARGYGLTDWLSVYGKIGLAHLEVDDSTIIKPNNTSSTNSFGFNLFTQAQIKARLWQHAPTGFEWNGSLQYIDIRAGHRDKTEGRWHEWQFASGVAKPFGRVKPYVGAKLNFLNMFYKVRQNGAVVRQGHYRQDSPIGLFIGSDVAFGSSEDVILNVETSYQDGMETNIALQYVF